MSSQLLLLPTWVVAMTGGGLPEALGFKVLGSAVAAVAAVARA